MTQSPIASPTAIPSNEPTISPTIGLDFYSENYLVCDSVYPSSGDFSFNVPTGQGCVDFFMSKQYANDPLHPEPYQPGDPVRPTYYRY